ncbi:MAG: hypothetical protein ACTSR8_06775 [Promethearchaeota archaeon]
MDIDIKKILMSEELVKKFLLLTILLAGLGIFFDFLGFTMVSAIQWIAGILILAAYIFLLVLTLILYLNIKWDSKMGKRIRQLNYLLLFLICVQPLLIGLSGMLTNGIYFMVPNTTDGASIASALSVLSLMVLLGYGLCLTLLCYLKLDDRSIWNL